MQLNTSTESISVPRRVLARVAQRFNHLLLGAALVAAGSLPAALAGAQPVSAAGFDNAAAESQLISLVNSDRAANGKAPLLVNPTLSNIARSAPHSTCGLSLHGRSQDMIDRGYFSHQVPPCSSYVWPILSSYGVQYSTAGENIGWNNYDPASSVGQVNGAFMASPGHKANILGDFNQVGVGAYVAPGMWGGYSGVIMYTEIFAMGPAPVPPPTAHVNALGGSQSSRQFNVSWAPDSGSSTPTGYTVFVEDGPGPWLQWYAGPATSATYYGAAGHSYSFKVQAYNGAGAGALPAAAQAVTAVASSATGGPPFKGLYTLDAFGGVHGVATSPVDISAYWPGWSIARSLATNADGDGGVVLDGFGGLHGFGSLRNTAVTSSAYWGGWDIARDVALLPDGSGGYVLDGWGGLHPFAVGTHAMPRAAVTSAYWHGWDIAHHLALFSDGTGGYVLDGYGGLHAFSTGGNVPADPVTSAYWGGWDIARGVTLIPGTHAGYVLDGFGGLHGFAADGVIPAAPSTTAYWSGWDIARAVVASPASTPANAAGWVIDGYGGIHQFGSAAAYPASGYWQGQDIARAASGR